MPWRSDALVYPELEDSRHGRQLAQRSRGHSHGTGARIGAIAIGYPDLVLVALLGASVAGTRYQARAAVLVIALAIGLDSMLSRGVLLPATVPRPWP